VIANDAAVAAPRYLHHVETIRRRLRGDLVDGGIIVLAWGALADAIVRQDVDHAVQIPAAPFLALPLLFRRRWPVAAAIAPVLVASAAATLDGRGTNALDVAFFCVAAAQVAAGSIHDRSHAVGAGAANIALLLYVQSQFPRSSVGDYLFAPLFFGAAWVVGRALPVRAAQTREMRARIAAADRERALAAERAAADERNRIARELHDVVAHSVSVMVVQASGVRRLLKDDQEREREALLSVERTGRQALAEMRRMLGVMRSGEEPAAALAPQPGLQSLDRLVAQVEEAGLPVTLRIEGERPELSPGIDLSAFRIVQEGLTNALKHAKGARAEVLIRYSDDGLHLEVTDDGTTASNGDGMGHGLVGMRERVALYGGTLEAGPREGGGFVLRADLPVEARA
jgi:signal transduction histidine kinase